MLSFSKEDVRAPAPRAGPSVLSSSLLHQQQRGPSAVGGRMRGDAARAAGDAGAGHDALSYYTVARVISSVLEKYRDGAPRAASAERAAAKSVASAAISASASAPPSPSERSSPVLGGGSGFGAGDARSDVSDSSESPPPTPASPLGSHAAGYYLMVADEHGQVDTDFPEIESSVPIAAIGVDKFVLCERGTDRAMLRLCIPGAALAVRKIQSEHGPLAELSVSCHPHSALRGVLRGHHGGSDSDVEGDSDAEGRSASDAEGTASRGTGVSFVVVKLRCSSSTLSMSAALAAANAATAANAAAASALSTSAPPAPAVAVDAPVADVAAAPGVVSLCTAGR